MGAKTHVKLKLRRPMFKCNICHRKMLSTQALKTHQYSVHKIESTISPSKAPARTAIKIKAVPKKVQRPPAPVSKVTIPINKPESSMQTSDNSDDESRVLAPGKVSDLRKIQFECPKCNVTFPAYFPTYKHIQKHHCINSKGQKVDASSADLIKPLRVEVCIKCNKRVRANDMHVCCETTLLDGNGIGMDYMCMGCKQKFGSMQLFDLHVSGLHSDSVESLFFPNTSEFLSWKTYMESKTKTNYLILGKCNLKQTYRCTYLPPAETTSGPNSTSHICPSSIVVQEFTKGIQVHFYKTHHGHKCPNYVCPDRYKIYLISSLMQGKDPEKYDVDYNEKDLYCQFKVLLESIIVEAAKVSVDHLKLMINKALEMTAIVNSYDEDDDTYTYSNKNSVSEEQIAKALDSLKGANKRKASDDQSIITDPKKQKKDVVPIKIINSFSMASKNDDKEEKKDPVKKIKIGDKTADRRDSVKKEDVSVKKEVNVNVSSPRVLRNTQIQSPSFNDTYKDFVDKNFKTPAETEKKNTNIGKTRLQLKQSELNSNLGKNSIQLKQSEPNTNIGKNSPQLKQNESNTNVGKNRLQLKQNESNTNVGKNSPQLKPSESNTNIGKNRLQLKQNESANAEREKGLRVRPLSKLVDTKQIEDELAKDNVPEPEPLKNVKIQPKNVTDIKINTPDITVKRVPPKENKGPNLEPKVPEIKKATDDTKGAVNKQSTPKTKAKKQVMKTKIGQFKPNLSPKSSPKSSPSPKKSELNKSIGKVKHDIEYEVMEQENDCNILILKI